MTTSEHEELRIRARRRLWASWEAKVAKTDQQLATEVNAGRLPVEVLAVWEQLVAGERHRRGLLPPGIEGIDL